MTLLRRQRDIRRSCRRAAVLLAAGALTACLAACGSSGSSSPAVAGPGATAAMSLDQLTSLAKKEGQLSLYSGTIVADELSDLASRFGKQYGIKVSTYRATSAPVVTLMQTQEAQKNVKLDVMINNVPQFYEAQPSWFVPVNSGTIPEVAKWPKAAVKSDYVINSYTVYGFAWNPNKIADSQVPNTWKDVTNSALGGGKAVIVTPKGSFAYTGFYNKLADLYGESFLKDIAKLDPANQTSGSTAAQLVASGSAGATFPAIQDFSTPLMNKGAPVKWKVVTPVISGISALAAVANGPDPYAGRLFVNWFLSADTQKYICQHYGPANSALDATGKTLGCEALPAGTLGSQVRYDIGSEGLNQELDDLGLS